MLHQNKCAYPHRWNTSNFSIQDSRKWVLDYVLVKSTRRYQGKHFLYSESWLETRDQLGVAELWVLLLIIGDSAFGWTLTSVDRNNWDLWNYELTWGTFYCLQVSSYPNGITGQLISGGRECDMFADGLSPWGIPI